MDRRKDDSSTTQTGPWNLAWDLFKSIRRPRYLVEILDEDEDDGTMVQNVDTLDELVVGHRIVSAEDTKEGFIITLDNNKQVILIDSDDCCAFTTLEGFFLDPTSVDHVILGVGTTDGYTTWHIYADFGDVMTMQVGWSCGNPFYYGYGFDIKVVEMEKGEEDG